MQHKHTFDWSDIIQYLLWYCERNKKYSSCEETVADASENRKGLLRLYLGAHKFSEHSIGVK